MADLLTKSANRTSITVGEDVTFTFVFSTTQLAAFQCVLTDNLPPCLQFVPGSVYLNGNNIPDANPAAGIVFFNVPDIPSQTISFTAVATCVPPDGFVTNTAAVNYTLFDVPHVVPSNPVQIQITELATCDAVGQQLVDICVPVSVQPFATIGPISVTCCGTPIVEPGTVCSGTPNTTCDFTISQTICVAVPVEFGAVVTTGETRVDCAGQSCANCPLTEQLATSSCKKK